MLNDKISIAVPVYNVEGYLNECLESLIAQSYKNLEIIIVDDGSTDKSGDICDAYAKKDSRIRVIHQENMGLVGARKTALSHATGEYIGFVDSDDYIDVTYFEKMYNAIKENEADICYNKNIVAVRGDNCYKYTSSMKEQTITIDSEKDFFDNFVFDFNSERILPSIWSKLYKSEIVKKAYEGVPNEQSHGEDLICFCLSIEKNIKISICTEASYFYRLREGSLTRSNSYFYGSVGLCKYLEQILLAKGITLQNDNFFKKFYFVNLAEGINSMGDNDFYIPIYHLRDIHSLLNKKIVVYGAGNVGKDIVRELKSYKKIDIIAWCDEKYQVYDMINEIKIENPQNIVNMLMDYVVVCTMNPKLKDSIISNLVNMGISKDKILADILIWK